VTSRVVVGRFDAKRLPIFSRTRVPFTVEGRRILTDISKNICLVTGGSGFLGIHLIRFLLSRGFAVRSLDIEPFDYTDISCVDSIVGDIRSESVVETAMAGASIVIHCAATLPLAGEEDIRSTTIDGTDILLKAAKRHSVRCFVYISTAEVYGDPEHVQVRESHPLNGLGPHAKAKIEAEKLCQCYRSNRMGVTILRPNTFVGPERLGGFELLYDWAYEGRNFPVLGAGDELYQLLDVEDLCNAILLCLSQDYSLISDTFNVGALRYGSTRQSFQSVLDRAGHGGRVVAIPRSPAKWTLYLLSALLLSPLYRWIYQTARVKCVVSTQKLKLRTGFRPRYSNNESLIRNYDWYVKHRSQIGREVGVTNRKPIKRGVFRLAKWLF
jgi:nucleoside-diphosphate-sugar epimerase